MRRWSGGGVAALFALVSGPLVLSSAASASDGVRTGRPLVTPRRVVSAHAPADLLDSWRGRSGKLRARLLTPSVAASVPALHEIFGSDALSRPGIHETLDSLQTFRLITMRPFTDKVQGRIGRYSIGTFPSEQLARMARSPANPAGFVEVTMENRSTAVSEHFRLGDFLTHDQAAIWPKYLVLREPLLDKLELMISELRVMGVPVTRLRVMSGFRTPQYNALGVGAGGRVRDSRHQFGDAADVYVMSDQRDYMSDLNRDGRVDTRDARVLADAADRVERAHPELLGGVGVYPATTAHGPFVHVDVRGARARWGSL